MKQINEVIEPGEHGHLFDPSKQALYNNPIEVEKLFPNLGPQAQRYIEIITGDAYKKAIERLSQYTGKRPETLNLPTLLSLVMNSLRQVTQLQRNNKEELEQLAVDIVLNLPEFAIFKNWVSEGKLKIKAELTQPNLDNAIVASEQEGEQEEGDDQNLTPTEEIDSNLALNLVDASDNVLKRKFANMMTQGNAVNKLYLFQLASERLNEIDPRLVNLYGVLSSIVQTSYYALPVMPFTSAVKGAAVGSEEVVPEEDGYVIIAKSPYFPYLVHEIVKGCWDLLAVDLVSNEELGKETLDDEVIDIMTGPQLYTNMSKLIPTKDIQYLPYVYRLLLAEDINTIKDVISGGGKSQRIITQLLQKVKNMISDYESSKDEPYRDTE